jgi:hypothetical protein
VKPYVKTNKSDYIDAEAIAEAVGRPRIRFVPIKTDHQLDLQSLHRGARALDDASHRSVEAGFTPIEAIHVATENDARFLAEEDRIGTGGHSRRPIIQNI